MRRLTDNAVRAKSILAREGAPLSADCEQVLVRELQRVLSGLFDLTGDVQVSVTREKTFVSQIRAEAVRVRPFGVVK